MSESTPSPFAPPRTENLLAHDGPGGGGIPQGAIEALRKTRPWVILFAILSFLGSGLMVIAGLMMAVMGSIPGAAQGQPFAQFGWLIGLIYLLVGAAYVYPGVRLLQYGLAIGRLVQHRNGADLALALEMQMRFWRFVGILTLAILGLYAVILVVIVGAAATGALGT